MGGYLRLLGMCAAWGRRAGRVCGLGDHLCVGCAHTSSWLFRAVRLLESEMLVLWVFKEGQSIFPLVIGN